MEYVLDDIDYQIISIMQRDARITMKTLAEKIGMSAPAATERVRRLEEAEIISGYFSKINNKKIGLRITALFYIDVPQDKEKIFIEYVRNIPEVNFCKLTKAPANKAVMLVSCRDSHHLMQVQKNFFEIGYCTVIILANDTIKDAPVSCELGLPQEYTPLKIIKHD